ncbi:MAG: GNAT family N-acetyltransferase [Acidimicrobiia bacterium]|nr:GNAT family N-acetyltransferase [Acidimicrobiia bacterium]
MSAAIRPAEPDDLDEILALVRELAEFEQLADQVAFDPEEFGLNLFGDDPVASVLIAEIDGRVVGMALWFRTFSTFLGQAGIWLEDLYVRPADRGQGIGTALLHRLRSMTDGRVEWSVLDWNERAIEVYRGLGARPLEGWTTYRWLPEG